MLKAHKNHTFSTDQLYVSSRKYGAGQYLLKRGGVRKRKVVNLCMVQSHFGDENIIFHLGHPLLLEAGPSPLSGTQGLAQN